MLAGGDIRYWTDQIKCLSVGDGDVRMVATWSGKSDMSACAGHCVELRLRYRNGKPYAFQFP
jgi:hypothetical protein